MKAFWEYFENMNEYVYVADMDTYEVIYMNKKWKNLIRQEDGAKTQGRKCYEVFHHCQLPCKACNNAELQENQFVERKVFHPIWNKDMLVKTTMFSWEGRRYRMEFSIDADTQEQNRQLLDGYGDLEKMANDAIKMSLEAPTPDGSIDVVLEYLGMTLRGERTYVFEKNESGGDDNTYEWVREGVTPEKENLQNVPPEVCANWYRSFSGGNSIIIRDIEDIRESVPQQYEILKQQNIHSLVVVPLYRDGEVIGFYGVDNPASPYLTSVSHILQRMAYSIISSIKRRSLMRQLLELGYRDQLTGLGNRRYMWECAGGLRREQSLGVLYCDVTGLKHVNDTQGHVMGDKLICDACHGISRAFDGYPGFRIGGDEIVVLCSGIGGEDFRERTKSLRTYMEEMKIALAVGTAFAERCPEEIEPFIAEAEKEMYEDKRRYYEAHGIERRRG